MKFSDHIINYVVWLTCNFLLTFQTYICKHQLIHSSHLYKFKRNWLNIKYRIPKFSLVSYNSNSKDNIVRTISGTWESKQVHQYKLTINYIVIEDQEKIHSNTCECTQYLLQQRDQLDQTSDLMKTNVSKIWKSKTLNLFNKILWNYYLPFG